jgi:predicted PurR-regulated permease PerM
MTTDEKTNRKALTSPTRLNRVSRWEHLLPLLSRILVWGIIFGVIALLSAFFPLMFLTFVFAYLQASVVDRLLRFFPNSRTLLVVINGILFLALVIGTTIFLAPQVYQQAAGFAKGFSTYVQRIDKEIITLSERYPILQEALPELKKKPAEKPAPVTIDTLNWSGMNPVTPPNPEPSSTWSFKESPTGKIIGMLTRPTDPNAVDKDPVRSYLDQLANISGKAFSVVSTFFLAFLFSFLIVLDLPHLTASVRDLENTRLRFIYVEVADNVYQFGKVLGSTMEAQFYIAMVNTLLTAIGLYMLGLGEHIAFLSVIVFLCSFIPVAGVFISSIPICLIALSIGGTQLMLASILMIIVIHIIEGYILNPLIYGARLRINPVIVLIILTISGKLFHLWGLVLGVPICTYIFGHAIRYEKSEGRRLGLFKKRTH